MTKASAPTSSTPWSSRLAQRSLRTVQRMRSARPSHSCAACGRENMRPLPQPAKARTSGSKERPSTASPSCTPTRSCTWQRSGRPGRRSMSPGGPGRRSEGAPSPPGPAGGFHPRVGRDARVGTPHYAGLRGGPAGLPARWRNHADVRVHRTARGHRDDPDTPRECGPPAPLPRDQGGRPGSARARTLLFSHKGGLVLLDTGSSVWYVRSPFGGGTAWGCNTGGVGEMALYLAQPTV